MEGLYYLPSAFRQASNSWYTGNYAYNFSQEVTYPVAVDNDAGIVIRFSRRWAKVDYHEGRIIIYRDEKGKISVIEIEYEDVDEGDEGSSAEQVRGRGR